MNTLSNSHQGKGLLFFAFMLLAFNLRCHITSIPPVIAEIQSCLHLSAAAAGLLTSIPLLCFALFTPLASFLISRMSIARACIFSLIGVCIGVLIRSIPQLEFTFAGTVILGFSVTIGNIISLMIIANYFPDKKDIMTGFYVVAMSVGSMTTSAATAAISKACNWQFGIAVWSVIAFCALVLWILFSAGEKNHSETADKSVQKEAAGSQSLPAVWKRFPVYLLAIAFAAHTSIFYGLTAWLPEFLKSSLGMDSSRAGVAASILQIAGILGSFGIPTLATFKFFNRRNQFLLVTISWFLTPVGLILFPELWILWLLFGGIGSGGGFIVIFGLIMDQAIDLDDNRNLSTFVQAIGYIFAAVSPVFVGFMKQVSGSWFLGFSILSALAIVMAICGIWASLIHEYSSVPQEV